MISQLSTNYRRLFQEASALHSGFWLTDLSNLTALLFENLTDVNWVGFYLMHQGELRLGPFQGKAACTRIPLGGGVCGLAAKNRKIMIVPDVHEFPNHIVCDSRSRSEIVIPVISNGSLIGVLDVDSPKIERFTEEDATGLSAIVDTLHLQISLNGLHKFSIFSESSEPVEVLL